MRYLGLDLSLKRTAIVLLADTGRTFEDSDVPDLDHVWTHLIITKPDEYPSPPARLRAMRESLRRILALADVESVRMSCVEGYSYESHGAQSTAEWGGIARVELHEHGFAYIDLAPSRLKKFATGKGTGEKDGIRMHVLSRWDFESENNDQADAFVCARYAHAFGDRAGLIKAQHECFKKPDAIVVRPHVAMP